MLNPVTTKVEIPRAVIRTILNRETNIHLDIEVLH